MRAVVTQAIVTSATTRSDKSLSIRISTPELTADEKAVFFELQNVQCRMILEPVADGLEPAKEIKTEFDSKTSGQRLRGTLFVLWTQENRPGDFEDYYRQRMCKIIDWVKTKLEPP